MELAAYVCWRNAQAARPQAGSEPQNEFESAWDILDCDDKVEFVPEDPRAILANDPVFAPLLVVGLPVHNAVQPATEEFQKTICPITSPVLAPIQQGIEQGGTEISKTGNLLAKSETLKREVVSSATIPVIPVATASGLG